MSSSRHLHLRAHRFVGMLTLCVLLASAARGAEPPNLVLIVVDTLRADRLGVYGNTQKFTPFLDELAARGTVFANAYAPSSWTCPSVASLLTSRYPSQHDVNSFAAKLADDEITIAETLAEHGYVGGGFSANIRLTQDNGYAQGFWSWKAYLGRNGQPKTPASLVRRESLTWVESMRHADPATPIFLYLQLMETHAPYRPPEPFRSRLGRGLGDAAAEEEAHRKLTTIGRGTKGLSASEIDMLASLYDGEVATIDDEIGRFVGELQESGMLSNTLLVVTADHGEEFAEHGLLLHGFSLFEPSIRVPLIMVGPGIPRGRVVSEGVSLMDVAPTLLELLGVARPDRYMGRSLVPAMTGAAATRTPAGVQSPGTLLSELSPDKARLHQYALIAGTKKLMVTPTGQVFGYDLAQDPGEQHPLKAKAPPFVELSLRLTNMQKAWAADVREPPPRAELDDATKEKLRALGYQP